MPQTHQTLSHSLLYSLEVLSYMRFNKMGKFSILLMMVMMWCLASMAEAEYMLYKDSKQAQSVRINDLMKRMTLEEKIGQMTQIERSVASKEVMKKYFIGSVLSGGGSVPSKQATPETWINMVNDFQTGSLSTRLGIPYIYGIDAVHGHNNVYNATIFPHNVGLGVTRDPVLVKKIGAATALEVRATGIQYAFAPCIAVCRDPRWGRCYESYSEDTEIVRLMTEIIPGLQGEITDDSKLGAPFVNGQQKIAACAKHYLGDGGTHLGTNEGNTILDSKKLFSIHMPAYNDSVIKGVATIMTSYSSWNGLKMHANRNLVTGYLKNKLKFKGFVISDWQGIDRITDPPHANYTYSILAGINAGIDMFMIPYNYTEFIDGLTYLVENKFVPMSRIDDAVERILRVKFTMGLFENPLADSSMTKYLGHQEHRDLAREAVRKTLVLLKNGKSSTKPLLPLPKRASKILVAGSHANNIGYQCGGWTIEWQGVSGNVTDGTTILSAVEKTVDPNAQVIYNENPNQDYLKSNSFDFAIIVVGEPPYAETFGDNSNLTIPEPGPSTIKNVCGSVKCVVVLITGRPVVVQPFVDTIDALVAAWLPGTEGQGVTDVLFGDYGFTGKLARTWFKSVDQLPMNVGDPHYDPLYPFGFGLTTEPTKTT
ncbi:putative glucan 1,3-beta-glucosidase [Helianthus debilis subsp. tardiflorus]